eukprot:12935027-Prorocentrum_lima.AAC.1
MSISRSRRWSHFGHIGHLRHLRPRPPTITEELTALGPLTLDARKQLYANVVLSHPRPRKSGGSA